MQILKEISYKARCLNCDSMLYVSKSDLKVTMLDNVYFKCPVCYTRIYLNDEQRALYEL
jgi:hypothetical protein